MNLKRTILLLLVVPLVLSFQAIYAKETKIFNRAEILHGRVKQIIEVRYSTTPKTLASRYIYNIAEYDRVYRDESYNVIGRGSELALIRYFDDKYVRPLESEDTTGLILVDHFSAKTGEKVGSSYYHKDTATLYCKNIYDYLGLDINISTLKIYTAKDSLVFKQVYKYNNKGNLIAVTNSSGQNSNHDKIIIAYLAFDKQRNWLKRIEKMINNRKVIRIGRVERKITYY